MFFQEKFLALLVTKLTGRLVSELKILFHHYRLLEQDFKSTSSRAIDARDEVRDILGELLVRDQRGKLCIECKLQQG